MIPVIGERAAHLVRTTEGIQPCQGCHFGSLKGSIDIFIVQMVQVLCVDLCHLRSFEWQGYAFAEYLDGGVTDQAIAGLNGMQVQQLLL